MGGDAVLGIDFGTSFTVAALRDGNAPPRVLEVGGHLRLPSVVFVDDGGTTVVGATAEALMHGRPERGLRAPKRRIGFSEQVVLGGAAHQLSDLIGRLLREVLHHGFREAGGPLDLVLTHPAAWSVLQVDQLVDAVGAAGGGPISLVSEPVAGARMMSDRTRTAGDATIVVYDLGGGTLDLAVVRRTNGRFDVVGKPCGDRSIGGELFDELLVQHVGERHLDPDTWERILVAEDGEWAGASIRLRTEIRRAKEQLSVHPYADVTIALPDRTTVVRIERDEAFHLFRPLVEESVHLCHATLADAGLDRSDVDVVHLIGGGCHLPLISEALGTALPQSEIVIAPDPKTVVAQGATLVDARARTARRADAAPAGRRPAAPATTSAASLDVPLAPAVRMRPAPLTPEHRTAAPTSAPLPGDAKVHASGPTASLVVAPTHPKPDPPAPTRPAGVRAVDRRVALATGSVLPSGGAGSIRPGVVPPERPHPSFGGDPAAAPTPPGSVAPPRSPDAAAPAAAPGTDPFRLIDDRRLGVQRSRALALLAIVLIGITVGLFVLLPLV